MFCTHLTDERRAAQTREEDTKEHWALQSKEDVGEDDREEGDDIFFEKKIYFRQNTHFVSTVKARSHAALPPSWAPHQT